MCRRIFLVQLKVDRLLFFSPPKCNLNWLCTPKQCLERGRWKVGQEALRGLCGKQELRIEHLGGDPGAIPLWSCKRGRLALNSWRERDEMGSENWHLLCPR